MKRDFVCFLIALALVAGIHQANAQAGMALIPAGSFIMGDALDDPLKEVPLRTNYVSAFYVDTNLVSYALWQQVYQWARTNRYEFDHPGSGKAPNHPVQSINWYDAAKWCNARSEMEGQTPAYYTSATRLVVYRSGDIDLTNSCVAWSSGYRLPTSAEWEKAARGGANYSFYDVAPANGYDPALNDGAIRFTSPVGHFAPNGYGLHDITGNVFQWCWDRGGEISRGSQSDPRGSTSGWMRVFRGGDWATEASASKIVARIVVCDPLCAGPNIGFRSVLPGGQP